MKKYLLLFILVFIIASSGCSCSNKQKLVFSTNHINSEFNFVREYDVKLEENEVSGKYKKENSETYGEIEMTGSYTVELKRYTTNELADYYDEEYRNSLTKVFVYTTKLSLNAIYKKVSEEVHNDYIETTSYFMANSALTPILTIVKGQMSYLGANDDGLSVSTITENYTTIYNTDSYTISKKTEGDYSLDETKDYSYTQNTIVDNGYLLFCLESFPIENDKNGTLQVVSPIYGEDKSLTISAENYGELTQNEVKYQNVKLESFKLTSNSNGCFGGDVGKDQIIYLATDGDTQKIIRYLSPLTAIDSSYSCLGTLVFELK